MSDLRQLDRVIEAVARRFCATRGTGNGDSSGRFLTVAGERIAIEVAVMAPGKAAAARPRLRFDRVALGFVARLQAGLAGSVPDGQTAVVTITAPIWCASRTAEAVQEAIRRRFERRAARVRIAETINGNQVRARLVEDISRRASKVVGFVHNPDTDPQTLFDAAESLLRCIGGAAGKRARRGIAAERWLIVACAAGQPHIGTYRQVLAQLAIPTEFRKVLLVRPGGEVESLAG